MEALISQAMKDTATLRKSSVPWKDDEPFAQSYFTFDSDPSAWVAKTPSDETAGNGGINGIALY
ncbi:hypothetical protein NW757_014819, partial [Fusarium falciforme]